MLCYPHSPFECSLCNTGFYLGGSSQCVQCNACCAVCIGPGNGVCSRCAAACHMQAGLCVRTISSPCFSRCTTCNGGFEWNCLACASGYFLQPHNSGLCLATCPSGYQAVGGVCIGSDQVILSLQLDTITATVKSVNGVEVLNGQTSAYFPNFEPSDPIPSQHRGYYFSGNQYMQLPPSGGSGTPLLFSTSSTFAIWLRPQGGNQTVYHKANVLRISLSNTRRLIFEIFNPAVVYSYSSNLTLDKWVYLGITIAFSRVTGLSSINLYINGKLSRIAYKAETYIKDESVTATQLIGATAGLTDFYTGFIWNVVICNYVSSIVTSDFAGSTQPQDIAFPLSSCPFLQTINCVPCATECLDGCVRTTDCTLCLDPLCSVCSDFSSSCEQCVPHASKIASCECDFGFIVSPNLSSCVCPIEASFDSNTCNCPIGSYLDPSRPTLCQSCEPTCRTCIRASACKECHSGATLDSSGRCICVQSYFPDPTSSHCSLCNDSCVSCSSADICTECWPNAYLQDSKCMCSPGYFGFSPDCKPCPFGCSICKDQVCEVCFNGYFRIENKCVDHCSRGFREDTNQWVCLPKPNPYLNVTVTTGVAEFNSVILNFSQAVEPTLKLSYLDLSLTDTNSQEYLFNTSLLEITANKDFNLSLLMLSPSLPSNNELSIVFLHPEIFTDEYGNRLNNTQFVLTFPPFGPQQSYTTQVLPVSTTTSAAIKSLAAGAVAVGLLSGSVSSIIALINNVQMLTYFPLSTITLPENLKAQLIYMNLQSLFLNPFSGSVEKEIGEVSPPKFAREYGYESGTFLVNAGVIVASFAVNGGVLLLTWLLSVCRYTGISTYFRKVLQGFRWRNLLIHGIEAYLDLCIAAFLQVRCVLSSSTTLAVLNASLGCAVALLCLGLPCLLLYLSCIHSTIIQVQGLAEIPTNWTFLYAGLKADKGKFVCAYYALFVGRRLIYALTLIYLDRFALLQGIICSVHSVMVRDIQTVLYLSLCSPLKDRLEALTVTLSELSLAVLFTLFIAFNFSLSERESESVEIAAVVCIYIVTSIPTISGFIALYVSLRNVIRNYIRVTFTLKVQHGHIVSSE